MGMKKTGGWSPPRNPLKGGAPKKSVQTKGRYGGTLSDIKPMAGKISVGLKRKIKL